MENHISPPEADIDPRKAAMSERTRIREITAIGKAMSHDDLAQQYVESGKGVEAFRKAVLDAIGDAKPLHLAEDASLFGDLHQYSLSRAIGSIVERGRLDGYEAEVAQQLARGQGRKARGFFVPSEAFATRATMVAGTANVGGNLVGTDHLTGEYVGSLVNAAMVVELGARVLTGLSQNVDIPTMSGSATAAWVAESSAASASNQTFGKISLSPNLVTANVVYSRQLLLQSGPGIEMIIRDDLRRQVGLAIDLAAINGSGTSNQPTGVLNTTGVGTVALGTNGAVPTWGSIVDLVKEISVDNALLGRLGFLGNAKVTAKLRQTAKVASTDSEMIMQDLDRLIGYRYAESNQVPSDLTKGSGTDLSALIFANWTDLLIAEFGSPDVIVDPFTNATTGDVRVSIHHAIDIGVRHAESFAAITDMTA